MDWTTMITVCVGMGCATAIFIHWVEYRGTHLSQKIDQCLKEMKRWETK